MQAERQLETLAFKEVFRIKLDRPLAWYGVLSAVELKRIRDIAMLMVYFTTPVETQEFEAPHVISMELRPKKRSTRSEYGLSAAQPPAKRIKSEGM